MFIGNRSGPAQVHAVHRTSRQFRLLGRLTAVPALAALLLIIGWCLLSAPLTGQAAAADQPRSGDEVLAPPLSRLAVSPAPAFGSVHDASPAGPLSVTVTVLVPNGGEVWAGGRPYTIGWSLAGAADLGSTPITINVSYNDGASWVPVATSLPNTGSFVWTTPLVNSTQARIEVVAVDQGGNQANDRSNGSFTIWSNAPAAPQNLQAIPTGWTNVASFRVSWTNPAGPVPVRGAWYKLDLPPTGSSDGVFVQATQAISSIVPSGDGIHPVYVWLQDEFGRADHTQAASVNLRWDRTPPAPPFGLQGTPARVWTNVNSFTERWTNPGDLSGIVGVYYRINRPGMYATDGIFVSTTMTVINGIQVPADGKHDLYIWLVDAAGNVDHNNRNIDPQVFWYDATPPVSSDTLTPTPAASGWYSSPVTAVFSATDGPGGSGVDAIRNQLDNGGWSVLTWVQVNGEGTHRLSYYATDVAGNMEPTHTLTVPLDFTPPAVSLVAARPPEANGWYTAPVTLNLVVTDGLSGSGGGFYQLNGGAWQTGDHVLLPSDGSYTLNYYGQDNAGNRSPLRSAQVKLDATPPATAYLIDGGQGDGGWYVSPLDVRLIPSDSGSGVAATYYSINGGPWQTGTQFQLVTDGLYTLSFYSVDVAGNVENSFPVQVRLDKIAPGLPTALETTPGTWSRVNRFSVQWANPTDLSGIVGVYYRMDGEPSSPTDGIFSSQTNRLENLAAPGEGTHRLFLWLRDGAGNTDHRNRAIAPLLRFDATPPTTTLRIEGVTGDNGWYRSPIIVHLDALDLASGVAVTRYRLNAGAWVTGTSLAIDAFDKHVLEYASEDVAGNVEPTRQATLRIDPLAPDAPISLTSQPVGWQRENSFMLTWRDPLDLSGIAGAYVRFDGAPSGPTDGAFHPASQVLEDLQAPGEGRHDVYVWLRDIAGNTDHATAVALPLALWYDGTPPSTTITVTGRQGEQDWYVEKVTFTTSATDGASGVKETQWQVDDGAWTTGAAFTMDVDGQHIVRIASRDNAGNVETPHVYPINIDRQPPVVRMDTLEPYQSAARFDVSWSGEEPVGGSGLAAYDVQVRDGYAAGWQDWLTDTTVIRGTYQGVRGHTYFFRVRARDRAGNVASFTDGGAYTVIETVRNGDFGTGNFSDWNVGGILYSAVVPPDGLGGGSGPVARLGSPIYGESTTPPGNVPVGNATIVQTISIPALADVARPTLAFWYRVLSYDVLYSERLGRYVDDLEVSIRNGAGQQLALLLRAGNPSNNYGTLYDSGWHFVTLDLTPYAGQTVQLAFANYNREDNLFNTWSFVDSIQVQDWPYNRRVYLPLMLGIGGTADVMQGPAAPTEKADEPPPTRPQVLPGKR